MKKLLCLLLALSVLLSLAACKKAKTVSGPVETDPVLAARRDSAESYMRQMCTVLWSPTEEIRYTTQNMATPDSCEPKNLFVLQPGRTYRGIPYSFAGSTCAAFLEYAGEPDGNGVYLLGDIPWQALSNSSAKARIGTDGSAALVLSWGQVGANIPLNGSSAMTEKRGFLPVGDYGHNPTKIEKTDELCAANGEAIMYNAYAKLMKADGLVANTEAGGGHSMMAVSVSITYNDDGTINGDESYMTVLEQTKTYFQNEEFYTDPVLGDVYIIAGVDVKFTFRQLYETGHLPITCKAFTEVDHVKEQKIYDSNPGPSIDSFFGGYIDSNVYIDSLIATVYDENDKVVQECAIRSVRSEKRQVEVERILKDDPNTKRGFIDLEALTPGRYRITLACRLANGYTETVRDLKFVQ